MAAVQPPEYRNPHPDLAWATCDPATFGEASGRLLQLYNLCGGRWFLSRSSIPIIDPLNGKGMIMMPDTKGEEIAQFVESLKKCPKTGLHNPYKNVERYVMWGQINAKVAAELKKPVVGDFFAKLIQRCCPKSYAQSLGEVSIVRPFFENFAGDQPRFLAQGFSVTGDRTGQRSCGHRWPFGPTCIVAPFNFPLEIPALQLIGALMMGNKVLLKCASTTSVVMEQFIRFLVACGCPAEDVDLVHCGGRVMSEIIRQAQPRVTQFTGGAQVAEQLADITHGRVRLEDAGFDWKILGPDMPAAEKAQEYVAWQCDQDAYAHTGQKCSAESILFAHENWAKANFFERLARLAARRKFDDLTIAPVLSHTTEEMLGHAHKLCQLPGARVLFGARELENHHIPKCYGAIVPTAVFVPLEEMMRTPENFNLCTTEIFGPFQVITTYTDAQLPLVLEALERMSQHLTAAVVSNDPAFLYHVLGNSVNGTTYAGIRARTTGAPQNHWFGPAGDPRGAGIGSPEAILLCWTCHREIIEDVMPVPESWTLPPPS